MARVTERIPVTGLDCADCGADMRAAVRQLPGVQAVAVNVGAQEIAVTYDPTRTSASAIRAHMQTVGIGCR
jgi:copper chaperone CopZ